MIRYNKPLKLQNRLAVLVPLLVFGFMLGVAGWWYLRGGKQGADPGQLRGIALNSRLPQPHFSRPSPVDKLSYYLMSGRDSGAGMNRSGDYGSLRLAGPFSSGIRGLSSGSGREGTKEIQAASEKVGLQLEQLEQTLKQDDQPSDGRQDPAYLRPQPKGMSNTVLPGDSELNQLEQQLQLYRQPGEGEDSVLNNLGALVDRLEALEQADSLVHKPGISVAEPEPKIWREGQTGSTGSLSGRVGLDRTDPRFLAWEGKPDSGSRQDAQSLLHGEVPYRQEILDGSSLPIRILDPLICEGKRIPSGQLAYGRVSLQGTRLLVHISEILYSGRSYPLQLDIYDMDGLEGLRVPSHLEVRSLRQSLEQGLGTIYPSLEPGLVSQAAGAGLEAARSLIRSHERVLRVDIPPGYRIWLKIQFPS